MMLAGRTSHARIAANTQPLTASDIQDLYYQSILLRQKGAFHHAYQLLIERLDITIYPPELLAITAKLAFQTDHDTMGQLIVDRFNVLFPSHPERAALNLHAVLSQSHCSYILSAEASEQIARFEAEAVSFAHAEHRAIVAHYQHQCRNKRWQPKFHYHVSIGYGNLPALPPKMQVIRYDSGSILAGLCRVFGSPSCLDNQEFLLASSSYRLNYLQSEVQMRLQKTNAVNSRHLTLSHLLVSLEDDVAHAISPAVEIGSTYLINLHTTLGIGAKFEQFQTVRSERQNLHINTLQGHLSFKHKLQDNRWIDSLDLSLGHIHQFGDAEPYHRYQLSTQLNTQLDKHTIFSLAQNQSVQFAASPSLYGDITEAGFSASIERDFPIAQKAIDNVQVRADFSRTRRQTSHPPLWLTEAHQQQIDRAEIKFSITQKNLSFSPYIGLETVKSGSGNSLFDYSYHSVLFGLSYQI